MDTTTPSQKGFESKTGGFEVKLSENIPVLYTDLASVSASPTGIVLDFAQRMLASNQANIVSRIGMSREHALALLNVLKGQLDKTSAPS
jgi:hypothetical protein